MSNVPKLRFGEFDGIYKKHLFNNIFLFSTGKNIKQKEASPEFKTPCIRYGELYHMYNEVVYEIINRTNIDKSELHFSKGDEILLPSAGEDPLDIGSASALTLENVAIGRTINILRPMQDNVYSPKYVSYYINEKLKRKISTLAKGSSISNVYNSDLKKLEIVLPNIDEQQKIATFLTAVDQKIEKLTKKEKLLVDYKKGVMQKIFSQEIRFRGFSSEWKRMKLNELLSEPKERNFENKFDKKDVLSVSGKYGIVNQIAFQGRSFAGVKVDNYHIVELEDIVYTKSPLKSNPYGIIKSNKHKAGIVSTLYAVYRPKKNLNSKYLDYYFQLDDNTNRYLRPLVHKGAKNDMKINNSHVLSDYISIPPLKEQTKIANFLSSIDKKIEQVKSQIEESKRFKKGLLQQMFV